MENHPLQSHDTSNTLGQILLVRRFPKTSAHHHVTSELVYILQGTAVRKMQNAEIPVRAGDFCLTPPFSIHGYADAKDLKVITCYFPPDFFDWAFCDSPAIASALSAHYMHADASSDIPLSHRMFHDFDGTVRQLILKMEKENANRHDGSVELLRSYLMQILVHTYRIIEPIFSNRAISQITDFLKAHYAEPISLDSLSQLVGYTPQYVSKLFNREVGTNFLDFLQQYRIEQACVLLSHTDMSTAEVAAAVGYQDARHFAKLFRRYQMISPHEYRKAFMK